VLSCLYAARRDVGLMPAASTTQGVIMTPKERQKVQELQRQLVGEIQLADKLYAALVHGGFDHVWWAMQDYASARGIRGKQPPKTKKAHFKRIDNQQKIDGWRILNCEAFRIEEEEDGQ
jgi:hypothetical protein